MKVSVEIITGTFIDTDVGENATVKELKEKIAAEVKLPVTRLILVIGDEEDRRMVMEDEDEMRLRDFQVREWSHMYLFFKHPDLVSEEERSKGGGEDVDPVEEVSSDRECRRGNEEQDKEKINGEEQEDKEMKSEEEYRDEKVEYEEEKEEKEKNGEKAKDDGDDGVKEEARDGEEGDNKEET